jgi:hypothetical protein
MHWGSWMMWGSKLKSLGSNTGLANMTDYTNSIQNWRPCYYMQSRNMSPQPTTLLVPEDPPELESRHSTSMFRCHHPLVDPVLLPLPCTVLLCSQLGQDLIIGPVMLQATARARLPSQRKTTKASIRGHTSASCAMLQKITQVSSASTAYGAARTILITTAKTPTSNALKTNASSLLHTVPQPQAPMPRTP